MAAKQKNQNALQDELLATYPNAEWLPLADLLETLRNEPKESGWFQRELRLAHALNLKRNFDPALVGILYVAKRPDGSYWLWDGQHRAYAMRMLGIDFGPVLVSNVASPDEAARRWRGMNTDRLTSRSQEDFHAAVAQNDPASVAINNTVSEFGYFIPNANTSKSVNAISCASTLRLIYKRGGKEAISAVLDVLRAAWPGKRGATRIYLVYGLHVLLTVYGKRIDRSKLIARLRETTPESVLADMSAVNKTHHNAQKSAAYAFVNLYNFRRSEALKLNSLEIDSYGASPSHPKLHLR